METEHATLSEVEVADRGPVRITQPQQVDLVNLALDIEPDARVGVAVGRG